MNRKTVTLCMIVKDEEATIGQTIKSALAVVDDIIVGDTGSSDNTRLIAEGYGARVVDLVWGDDFAAARNAVLAEARTDWILILDADEKLQPVRPVEFQKLLVRKDAAGYLVNVRENGDASAKASLRQVRLFRNHPYVRYCYPVHETIDIALGNWAASRGMSIEPSPVAVIHECGGPDRKHDRDTRNRRLLRDASREYPYEPYFAYQLAQSSLNRREEEIQPTSDLGAMISQLEQAWAIVMSMPDEISRELAYGPDLSALLGAAKIAAGKPGEALEIAYAALELYPGDDYLAFRRAMAILEYLRDDVPVDASTYGSRDYLLKRARSDLEIVRGGDREATGQDAVWRGELGLRLMGTLALTAGDAATARRRFNEALSSSPELSSAWTGLGDLARSEGRLREALNCYLRAVTANDRNVRAWLQGSEALVEIGFEDNAATWRSRAEQLFPDYHGFHRKEQWVDDLLASVLKPVPAG